MIRRHVSIVILATTGLFAPAARAQEPAAGQRGTGRGGAACRPQNLQVFRKTCRRRKLSRRCRSSLVPSACSAVTFTCRPRRPGAGRRRRRPWCGPAAPAFDFPSDDKPQKKAARQMMLMVRDINPKVLAAVGKTEGSAARGRMCDLPSAWPFQSSWPRSSIRLRRKGRRRPWPSSRIYASSISGRRPTISAKAVWSTTHSARRTRTRRMTRSHGCS